MQGIQQGWANVFWNGPSLKNSDFWWATKFSEKLNDFQSWWSMRNTLSLNTKVQNIISDYWCMHSFVSIIGIVIIPITYCAAWKYWKMLIFIKGKWATKNLEVGHLWPTVRSSPTHELGDCLYKVIEVGTTLAEKSIWQ